MTVKKGGGRESGGEEHDDIIQSGSGKGVRERSVRCFAQEPEDGAHRNAERTARSPGTGDNETRGGLDGGQIAANPAACPICGATRDTEGHDFTERIRALETELLGQRPALEMAISREGFEKRRAEKAESDGRLLGKMLDAQNEKLHKAEARVKELEADLARHQDGERTAK